MNVRLVKYRTKYSNQLFFSVQRNQLEAHHLLTLYFGLIFIRALRHKLCFMLFKIRVSSQLRSIFVQVKISGHS